MTNAMSTAQMRIRRVERPTDEAVLARVEAAGAAACLVAIDVDTMVTTRFSFVG
jgi:hypothetical protein